MFTGLEASAAGVGVVAGKYCRHGLAQQVLVPEGVSLYSGCVVLSSCCCRQCHASFTGCYIHQFKMLTEVLAIYR